MRLTRFFAALGILIVTSSSLHAESEIVVAIRYLQAQGVSHSHLYLYREDGKLLRQLTNDNSGQDLSPVFSSDGSAIVFTREKPGDVHEFWSVEPLGTNLKKLDAAPDWYTQTKGSPFFTNIEPDENASPSPSPNASPEGSASPAPTPAPTFRAPDGSVEVVLREDPNDEEDEVDGPGHGKHFLLHDLKTGHETEFGKIPGFYGVWEILHENENPDRRFLFEGPLRLAFFGLHLDSTAGDTSFALDFTTPRFVRLSPNWAAPIPMPGEPAFLTYTLNRYVPIPGSKKTANCSYMERWDAKLNHIRYAREKTAAICNGASMYRPNQTPATINLHRDSD